MITLQEDPPVPRRAASNRELIELELTSLIQKLAFLRGGGMTPRTFPAGEYEVIESFGLACCRLAAEAERQLEARTGTYGFDPDGDYTKNPFDTDEDTSPGYRRRKSDPT